MKCKPWQSVVTSVVIISMLIMGCTSNSSTNNVLGNFRPLSVVSPDCNYGGEIKSVQAIDAVTVKFTLCEGDASFPSKIASPIFAIQDQEVLAKTGGDSAVLSTAPVGTGPYRLNVWEKAADIIVEPSSSYWGMQPLPALINFQWRADPAKRYSFTTMVAVDGIDLPPNALIPDIEANSSLRILAHPPLNLFYVGFNNKTAPFNSVEVRKAFALLLDREKIIRQSFPQGSELAQQMVPSFMKTGRSATLRWYDRNLKDAQDLLASANFDFDQEITLAFPNARMEYLDSVGDVALKIQQQLAEINLKLTLKPLTVEEFQQSIKDGKEMLYINWFKADYEDGAAFFEKPFISDAALLGDSYTDIQHKLKDVQAASDVSVRQKAFDELNQLVKDQVPLIPLGHAANLSVFRASVSNLAANPFYENFEDLSGVDSNFEFVSDIEPKSLWPADEDNFATFRITRLLYDTLVSPGFGNVTLQPQLAESWTSNETVTEWTFQLRYNVRFSNGTTFDANDVVASFSAIWDASDVNHKGRTGEFAYYKRLFGKPAEFQITIQKRTALKERFFFILLY
jgi:peptide/nickel transport system substrate-binding protein